MAIMLLHRFFFIWDIYRSIQKNVWFSNNIGFSLYEVFIVLYKKWFSNNIKNAYADYAQHAKHIRFIVFRS